jgi:hypothetical protein
MCGRPLMEKSGRIRYPPAAHHRPRSSPSGYMNTALVYNNAMWLSGDTTAPISAMCGHPPTEPAGLKPRPAPLFPRGKAQPALPMTTPCGSSGKDNWAPTYSTTCGFRPMRQLVTSSSQQRLSGIHAVLSAESSTCFVYNNAIWLIGGVTGKR